MQRFIAPGHVVDFIAPVGGVVTGESYMIEDLLVVADETKAAGATFRGATVGVFAVRKTEEVWTECAKVYFDETYSPDPIYTVDVGSPALPLVGVCARSSPLSLVIESDDSDSPTALTIDVSGAVGTIAVDTFGDLAGDTLTVTINGTAHTLTEGVDFDAETSDAVTATNLGAALAKLPGVSVSVVDDDITITVLAPSTTGYVRLDGMAR